MSASKHQSLPTAVQWSHRLLEPRLHPGMNVVDATAGNGHDSLFLAQRVQPGGRVFIFDIQAAALESTRRRLAEHQIDLSPEHMVFHHTGHENLGSVLPAELHGHIHAVMFNLGYLPGGDKTLITLPQHSLDAIQQSLEWLAPDGMITIVLYPGHEGGREEADQIEAHLQSLSSLEYEVQKIAYLNYRPTTPFLIVIRRKV